MAAVSLGIGTVYLYWRPPWLGTIVLPLAFGVFPVAFTAAGIWTMAATSWIDRHQAWDRVATKEEREADEESRALMGRSLPLGLLLSGIGGAAGALVGWVWETEVGIPVGLALGALGGLVLGSFVGGLTEGVRSGAGKSGNVNTQDADQSAAAERPRD